MQARRRDHVTAVCANVEPGPELPGGTLHLVTGVGEVHVLPAAARQHLGRLREFAVFAFELGKGAGASMLDVDVEHEQPGSGARRDADRRFRVARPPREHGLRFRARVEEAMLGQRNLPVAGEDWEAAARIGDRGLKHSSLMPLVGHLRRECRRRQRGDSVRSRPRRRRRRPPN